MLGAGLKKLAKQYDLRVDAGVAYGSLRGYATTLFEGAARRIFLTTLLHLQIGVENRTLDPVCDELYCPV